MACSRNSAAKVRRDGGSWWGSMRYVYLLVVGLVATPTYAESVLESAIQHHCIDCHEEGGEYVLGVSFAAFKETALRTDTELLTRIVGVLDRREMPPQDVEPLPEELRVEVLESLYEIERDAVSQVKRATTPIRRMNRFQYSNAVTDLFGLRCAVFTLPEQILRYYRDSFQPESGVMPDTVHVGNRPLGKSQLIEPRLAGVAAFPQDLRAEHGYDNRADHLSLSPLLLESFLNLGQSITTSPDFSRKNVGVWDAFFKPPAKSGDYRDVIQLRLEPFLAKAFRQPVDVATLERYTAFAHAKLSEGAEFTDVMKSVAAAILASPRFLYLHDDSTGGDFALASRLSFFLWGSLPDERLLSLAAKEQLRDKHVFDAEITRMLSDRKIKRFLDSFPRQWLQLERLISSVPNREKFPGFYFSKYRASMHMMLEPLLLFETIFVENRPIAQLIDPDFTYRSEHLERAYGELATPRDLRPRGKANQVTQLTFYRVPVTDRRTGGLITNAAVMTMTSGSEQTKPISRGAWVASVIFNAPPPPPPADIAPLAEHPIGAEAKRTLRERITMHRQRADCRGCHERIDPLGFALENYDAVGAWRDVYTNGRVVDAAGALFRSRLFRTPVEFKDAVLAEKRRFIEALAGHLLAFAVARELTVADREAIRSIARRTAADSDRMQTLVREVLASEPFQTAGDR